MMSSRIFLIIVGLGLVFSGCEGKSQEEEKSAKEPTLSAVPPEPASTASGPLVAPEGSSGKAENDEGITHYKQEHWDVAEQHFRKAMEGNPELAEAHYNIALALDKLGNHPEATAHFTKALELAPDNPAIRDSAILKAHVQM
jgi:Flp pilus assembly protein TadD